MYTTITKRCPRCRMAQDYTPSADVHQPCAYHCGGCLCGDYCTLDPATRQELRERYVTQPYGSGPPAGLMVEKD